MTMKLKESGLLSSLKMLFIPGVVSYTHAAQRRSNGVIDADIRINYVEDSLELCVVHRLAHSNYDRRDYSIVSKRIRTALLLDTELHGRMLVHERRVFLA